MKPLRTNKLWLMMLLTMTVVMAGFEMTARAQGVEVGTKVSTAGGTSATFDTRSPSAIVNSIVNNPTGFLQAGAEGTGNQTAKDVVSAVAEANKTNFWDFATNFGAVLTASVSNILAKVVFGLNLVLLAVASTVFQYGGYLIDLGLRLNASVIQSPLVQSGWLISRNFANLGVVLGMIMIAFATILRIESFGVKNLLQNLIMVALLINFSLIIPGVFIDATGVLANFFNQKISGADISKVTEVLASSIDIQRLTNANAMNPDLSKPEVAGELSQSMISVIVQLFLTVLFTFLAAVVMLATAFMLLYRYIMLTFLLILGPIVAVLYIFPFKKLSSQFSRWWGSLLQWTFFLPAVMFFLYLTVLTTTGSNNFIDIALNAGTAGFSGAVVHLFAQLGKMVVILFLMVGGLIAGQELGIEGSKWGMSIATDTKDKFIGAIKGAPGAMGGWTASKTLGRVVDKDGTTAGQWLAARMAALPMLRGVAESLDKISTESVDDYKKQYAGMSNALLMSTAKRTSFVRMSSIEAAAITQQLASKKLLAKMDLATLQALKSKGRAYGANKEIDKVRPDYADSPEATRKIMNGLGPQAKLDLPLAVYENKGNNGDSVILSLTDNDTSKISKDGTPELQKIIKDRVTDLEKKRGDFKDPGDQSRIDRLINWRDTAII